IYHTGGGLLFVPDAKHYVTTRCQPVLSTRLPIKYSLDSIVGLCAERSLEVRLVVSASRAGRLADRYPEFACRTAWGEESARSLCLANADVQGYLQGLVANLTERYAPEAIVLADLQ